MPYLRNHRKRESGWTAAEDEALSALYETMSAYAVGRRIGRTESAVWRRARTLSLSKRTEVHHPWSDAELADLEQHYSVESPTVTAQRLGRSATAVTQQARALGLVSRRTLLIQSVVGDYFLRIDSPEQAYILGLLAADGNVSDTGTVSFGLQDKDAHLVRFVHSRLAPTHTVHISRRDSFASFSFISRMMAADLARWGVVPRKSRVLEWPSALGELQRPFLLGYFDGDGSACIQRRGSRLYPNWSVCSGSRQFLVNLKDYVLGAVGVNLDKIQHRPNTSLYQVSVAGSGAYVVDKWLHQEDLGLDRKRYPAEVLERYEGPSIPGRTRNGVPSRWYSAEAKADAVAILRGVREANGGVRHGDVTRVAAQIGVERGNLRRWAIEADAAEEPL